MSSVTEVKTEEADVCCASCGIAPVDDIKLKICDGGCDLVKYCSDRCQGNHRDQHEEDCKKRKAELHSKELFEQPDGTHLGECPICFLPLPIDLKKSTFCSGCCKLVCKGCVYAKFKSSGKENCAFCREPPVVGDKKNEKRAMKRVKVNDPAALSQMGTRRYREGDYETAFEYFRKAAELGDSEAHYQLGIMYRKGEGVEEDEKKAIYHYEKAAIGGQPHARYNLACDEWKKNDIERSVKHFIIAAKLGLEQSMKQLWKQYSEGRITKQDLEDTLRCHKAAIDATKSVQREEAEAYFQRVAASRR
jgi:TPR repeat protein